MHIFCYIFNIYYLYIFTFYVPFCYTLHFLNEQIKNIRFNISLSICNFCAILLYTWLLNEQIIQYLLNLYSILIYLYLEFLHNSIIHFTFKWTNYTVFTQFILLIHYLIFKYLQFGTNHYTLINIFQNAQITILIESIYNISFFKYLHFTHISVKCFTFEKFKLHSY